MRLVNGAHFSNITFLLALFASTPAVAMFGIVTVFLTCMYASL